MWIPDALAGNAPDASRLTSAAVISSVVAAKVEEMQQRRLQS